jgi:predicted membrane protein
VRWVELIVYGSLAVLGLATLWILFRAVTGKGAWWALEGLLVVVLLAGLVFRRSLLVVPLHATGPRAHHAGADP